MSRLEQKISNQENPEQIRKLIEKCATGEVAAIREFFESYSQDIYNFPLKIFHLDEDQSSDFFLYAFEKLKSGKRFASFKGRARFRTWFYTVLRNLVIDWMRTVKELRTVQLLNTIDDQGNESRIIENIADQRSLNNTSEGNNRYNLADRIADLEIEARCIFKLSYLYYFNFEAPELELIASSTQRTVSQVLKDLSQLKNELTTRAMANLESLDKITALYLKIIDLKADRDQLQRELQHYPRQATNWSGPGRHELEKIQQLIEKKKRQRERLLEKKQRGNFVVRTPHREIARLMEIPEGSVSVQLNRIVEKISRDH